MQAPTVTDLARHLDRVRRRTAPSRPGTLIREFSTGWLTARPSDPPAQFPSASQCRIFWLDPPRPLEPADLQEGIHAMHALDVTRAFIWLAPWAALPTTDAALTALGAARWPYVEYIAYARSSGALPAPRPTDLHARPVPLDDIDRVLRACEDWYTASSVAAATHMARSGNSHLHAAFDHDLPVALAFLSPDQPWAYLTAAATAPSHRTRGAQGALIRSRLLHAQELGAHWCSCETNTTVQVSLRNLVRHGFIDRIRWLVYAWDSPSPSGSASPLAPPLPRPGA